MAKDTLQQIQEALGHLPSKWTPTLWLNTGVPELNGVLGSPDLGVSYGRIIEISGWEGHGKTAIMMALAALAQHDGAFVVWGDAENSWDPRWALQRGFAKCPKCNGTGVTGSEPAPCSVCGGPETNTCGLDKSKLLLIQPYVGRFTYKDPKTGKMHVEKEPRLSYAQELLSEMEMGMSLGTHTKRVVVVDSVAALLTEGESEAGIEGANLRSDMDLPKLMSRLLRRWAGTVQVYNTLLILVNQLREGPGSGGFGSNAHTPGGNAPKFYSHIRVTVGRVKGSKIVDGGRTIGMKGVMKNIKNKTGGVEGSDVGYKILFKGPIEFLPSKDVREEAT